MFGQEPNRIAPKLPAEAMKTYQIVSPLATHTRPATCAEVDCGPHRDGWRLRVEGLPPGDVHLARTCGRRFVEQHVAEGETWLVFEAGQSCFRASEHRAPVGRPELFVVRDGDWRGNPRGTDPRKHARPGDWVDDFATHQQAIADEIQKG